MAVVAPAVPPPEAKKPMAGFVLSLIAGILILINGLAVSAIGALFFTVAPGLGALLMAIGVLFGILVIVGAVLMYKGSTTAGGVLVILFGILSIVIGGGFIIGLILAIIGGALGIAGK